MLEFFRKRRIAMVKLLAYDSLIRHGFTSLPIDFQSITDNVYFISLQFLAEIHGDSLRSYTRAFSKYGFIVYSPQFDIYGLFYNADLSDDMIRWVKCCGLAYIDMGLVKKCKTIDLRDYSANTFAFYFSCPDAVLIECEICTAEDIIKYCSVPFQKARKKSEYISDQYYSTRTTLDGVLLEKFNSFINFFKRF